MPIPPTDRTGYLETFEQGGADALNALLRLRNQHPNSLERELMRMAKSGRWIIHWADEGGWVVGRHDSSKVGGRSARPAIGRNSTAGVRH
jgi:hypothetical protein